MDVSVDAMGQRDWRLPLAGFKGTPDEIERQWYEQIYRGHGDSMAQLTWRAVETPLSWGIFYAISGNTRRYWDIGPTQEQLGYQPEDDAERYAAQIEGQGFHRATT